MMLHWIVAVSQPARRRRPVDPNAAWRRPRFTVTCECGTVSNSATEHEQHAREMQTGAGGAASSRSL